MQRDEFERGFGTVMVEMFMTWIRREQGWSRSDVPESEVREMAEARYGDHERVLSEFFRNMPDAT